MSNSAFENMSDEDLLAAHKKVNRSKIVAAFFIGFAIGIIVFSIAVNTWGFATLILLYLVHKMVNDPGKITIKELEEELKKRNLR